VGRGIIIPGREQKETFRASQRIFCSTLNIHSPPLSSFYPEIAGQKNGKIWISLEFFKIIIKDCVCSLHTYLYRLCKRMVTSAPDWSKEEKFWLVRSEFEKAVTSERSMMTSHQRESIRKEWWGVWDKVRA
jgi:hypothetical protein